MQLGRETALRGVEAVLDRLTELHTHLKEGISMRWRRF